MARPGPVCSNRRRGSRPVAVEFLQRGAANPTFELFQANTKLRQFRHRRRGPGSDLGFVNANGVVLRNERQLKLGGQQTEVTALGLQPGDDSRIGPDRNCRPATTPPLCAAAAARPAWPWSKFTTCRESRRVAGNCHLERSIAKTTKILTSECERCYRIVRAILLPSAQCGPPSFLR
jgi:hypothetical protein